MADTPAANPNGDSLRGFLFALAAYLLWGFLPIYMKAMAGIPPSEIIAHRIVWSVPIAGVVLIVIGRTRDLRAAITNPRMLGMAAMTAALISVNWWIYVWAIGAGHALDAALGYYINPLFSVALGAILLRERLNTYQIAAVILALAAVVYLTIEAGRLPLVALALTVSWGFYAYLRKTLPIGPNQGFFLEVAILFLPALVYLLWLQTTGRAHFMQDSPRETLLLVGCGIVTAGPLMIYANGAKLLRLSTIGMMQYIAPTMIFVTAIAVFHEPFDQSRMIAFAIIWVALAIYSLSMLRGARR